MQLHDDRQPPLSSSETRAVNSSSRPISTSPFPNLSQDLDYSSSSTRSSDPVQLHVEEFLQRLAPKPCPRRYGRRGRRAIELATPSSKISTKVSSAAGSDDNSIPGTSAKRQRHHRVDEDHLTFSPVCSGERTTASEQPLDYAPVQASAGRAKRRAVRPWSSVHPKRGVALHAPSFNWHNDKCPPRTPSVKQQPLDHWRSSRTSIGSTPGISETQGTTKTSLRSPLFFIPIKDAEAAYLQKFHPAHEFCQFLPCMRQC